MSLRQEKFQAKDTNLVILEKAQMNVFFIAICEKCSILYLSSFE